MKTHWKLSVIAVAAMTCMTISTARAGERGGMGGGPLQHILDSAKELNLTEDQKTKLQALAKEHAANRDPAAMKEKFKNNPAMMETLKEMKAARESGDEAKMKELRAKMMANGGGEGGGKGENAHGEILQKLMQILTPEQMKKLKEMRENSGEHKGLERRGKEGKEAEKGDDKSNKPDASKGVPVPFE